MKGQSRHLLLVMFLVVLSMHSTAIAQQYTYAPTNPGCNGQWINGDCWDITYPDPSCTVSNSYPPGASTCHTEIIINDDLSRLTSISFPGNTDIYINDGASLTFGNNVTIDDDKTMNVVFEEPMSTLTIGGNLTVNDQATFSLTGDTDRLPSDPTSNFSNIGNVKIDGTGTIAIDANAGMDIEGNLDIHTPSNNSADFALIDVDGIFNTTSIIVRGNSHLVFEVAENSTVIASEPEGTLEMNGNSSMTFIGDYNEPGGDEDGDSIVEVGGNIDTNGSGALITADDATIYTCYEFPSGISTEEFREGQFFEGECSILPVIWLDFSAEFDPTTGYAKLHWSTAKEWESSHFEIERVHASLDSFQIVGQLTAKGWSDQPSSYSYYDKIDTFLIDKLHYRIKQVDFDETHTYTKVIALTIPINAKNTWTAYPNPSTGQLFLLRPKHFSGTIQEISVRLYSPATSNEIGHLKLPAQQIIPIYSLMSKAPLGLLILEINWDDKTEHIKILHQ
ncbi:hypothetical protein FKX85_03550 [Echinicola soli]|uniref:Uncharacterized protein n=1 Tax=Echinicola soli TaxID=2591634 RepID=A0A514CEB4_9BACT|nr:hypothetical protein [Echinicola soli]QDH78162.1 hypothetical protein FKX85_03550 [Echinicola soli]